MCGTTINGWWEETNTHTHTPKQIVPLGFKAPYLRFYVMGVQVRKREGGMIFKENFTLKLCKKNGGNF